MRPSISVVIPTYRRPKLLAACLHALSSQILANNEYEILIVSDGQDVETSVIIDEFKNNGLAITYYELAEKKGPAAARNLGWKNAYAPLVAFTDDDCRPAKNWLFNILTSYNGEPNLAFSGKVIVPISGVPTDYQKNTAHLETASFITANCCCTKHALVMVGGFDERFSMAWREDSDLEFKLLLNNIPIVKLGNAVVEHPVRDVAWGISIKEQKKGMFNALLYKKYPKFYREKIQANPSWDYYMIVALCIAILAGFAGENKGIVATSLIAWFLLYFRFVLKRLNSTCHNLSHVMEMITTSLIIPFASVYWQLYGSFKYRVLFL